MRPCLSTTVRLTSLRSEIATEPLVESGEFVSVDSVWISSAVPPLNVTVRPLGHLASAQAVAVTAAKSKKRVIIAGLLPRKRRGQRRWVEAENRLLPAA